MNNSDTLGTELERSAVSVSTLELTGTSDAVNDSPGESEYRYRDVMHALPSAIYLCDERGHITFLNTAAAQLWGREPDLGRDLWCGSYRSFRPDGSPLPRDACTMACAIHDARPHHGEALLIERPDGERRIVLAHATPTFDRFGNVTGASNLLIDITEQRRSEAELRDFVENAPMPLQSVGPDGTILWANDAALQLTGRARDEYIGQSMAGFHADAPVINDILSRVKHGDTVHNQEARLRLRDGTARHVLITANARFDEGRFVHARCFMRDFTLRKQAEVDLREREARFRHLADSIPNTIYSATPDGDLTYVNRLGQEQSGLTRELLGKGWLDFVHPDDWRKTRLNWLNACEKQIAYESEFRFKGADGTYRWILSRATPILDPKTGVVEWIGGAYEIHDMKLAQQALFESEQRYRALVDLMSNVAWTAAPDGDVIAYQSSWARYTGQTWEQMREFGWLDVIHSDDRTRVNDALHQARSTHSPQQVDGRVWHAESQQYRYMQGHWAPVFSPDGSLREWVGSGTDIHDRMLARQALLEGHARLQEFGNALPHMAWSLQADGTFEWGNHRIYDFIGVQGELPSGWDWSRIVHAADVQHAFEQWTPKRNAGEAFVGEYRLVSHDGITRWFLIQARPLFDAGGMLLRWYGTAVDIHERKIAEQALAESEARFRVLADNIPQMAWIADERGGMSWFNQRWYDYTGTTVEDVQGRDWRSVHHPDHVDRVVAHWQQACADEVICEDTFPLRSKDGDYRWFLTRAVPNFDENGKLVRWFGTNTDVTKQLEAEAALAESNRQKTEFLAVLAHELRNPLAPIRNALHLMKAAGPASSMFYSAWAITDRQTTHLARLVDDLMEVSRVSKGRIELRREPLDLRSVIRQAVENCRSIILGQRHELVLDLPSYPICVEGDPMRLDQIFNNLLNNACKYTPPGGRIGIAVEQREDQSFVSIRDNGIAIPEHLLGHIFELFTQVNESLKHSQGGLGIGLSLVKTLVSLHHGTVHAKSAGLGKGSEFIVRLPVAAALPAVTAVEAQPATSAEAMLATAARRILVVDDSRDAADSMVALLGIEGHDARQVYDGHAALETGSEWQPDVVLLDIGLPGLDGFQVAQAIRQQPWGERVVLIALTGWGQPQDRERSAAAGFDHHLTKPTSLAEINTALGRPTPHRQAHD